MSVKEELLPLEIRRRLSWEMRVQQAKTSGWIKTRLSIRNSIVFSSFRAGVCCVGSAGVTTANHSEEQGKQQKWAFDHTILEPAGGAFALLHTKPA